MISYKPYGDKAILITFSDSISENTHKDILSYSEVFRKVNIPGLDSFIPAYNTIVVKYNPLFISYENMVSTLRELHIVKMKKNQSRLVRIPVCYHDDFSIDMVEVENKTGLTKKQIISKHTKAIYTVYMIGFMPGFFYLGGLDEALFCPRKETPRMHIFEGAVGIGGEQTGVYPLEGPGGWQIIGRTLQRIFDKNNVKDPFYVKQGDTVEFYEISRATYNNMTND